MKGVRYISLAENSGYGNAGQSYILALLHAGIPVQWLPLLVTPQGYRLRTEVEGSRDWVSSLADPQVEDGYFSDAIQNTIGAGIDYDAVILHCTPEHWPRLTEPGKRNIGYTVWETDTPPPPWTGLMQSADQVLVPSQFSRTVFERAGIERPIDVIPHISRPKSASPSEENVTKLCGEYSIPRQSYLFYAIEAWTARKALWKTIHAFLDSFSGDDPVSLIVKTDPEGPRSGAAADTTPTRQLVDELISHYPNPARTVLIDHRLSSAEIAILHTIGDCYLSLTHSEGWGLGAFEAGAAGNPAIITGWGGQLDYLGSGWPYLIDFEMTPVMDARGRNSYLPSQLWASPSHDHAVHLIRRVFEHRERAQVDGQRLQAKIVREFNEAVVGRTLHATVKRSAEREDQ